MGRIVSGALAALVGAALFWAAWWPVAAWRAEARTADWLEARRAAGWQAEWRAIDVTGFPLAYTRRIGAPALADPATGWAWQADTIALGRPRHSRPGTAPVLTITLPPTHVLQTPRQRIALAQEVARLDLARDMPDERVLRADLTVEGLEAVTDEGRAGLERARLTATADAARPERYSLTFSADSVTLPAPVARALAGADLVPGAIERVQAEAEVTFDRPWDRRALEERRPQPRVIDVSDAVLRWGALDLRVAGRLDVAEDGTPEGELLLKATNWRDLLGAARGTGVLPDAALEAAEAALELVSRLAGSPRTLDIPLRFENARTRIGPVPIGPAPVLRLR